MTHNSRLVLGIYYAVGALNILFLAIGASVPANCMKFLLLPLLVVFAITAIGWDTPTAKFLIVGQFFAWLGDISLMSDASAWFLIGIAMFFIMQVCYVIGFFALGARNGLRNRVWPMFAFPLFWVAANIALWPGLGSLRIPIGIYSLALVTMAMCATGVSAKMGVGGTLFMLSDLMIGATVAYGHFWGSAELIMITYIIGQGLIALAWSQRLQLNAVRIDLRPGD